GDPARPRRDPLLHLTQRGLERPGGVATSEKRNHARAPAGWGLYRLARQRLSAGAVLFTGRAGRRFSHQRRRIRAGSVTSLQKAPTTSTPRNQVPQSRIRAFCTAAFANG